MTRTKLVTLLSASVALPALALAQNPYEVNPILARQEPEIRRLELAGFVGSLSFSQSLGSASNLYQTVSGQAGEIGFGRYFGVRASWAFTKHIVAEAEWSYGKTGYNFVVDDNEAGPSALGEAFDAEQIYWSGAFLYQVPIRYGIVPYGVFGVGQLQTTPSIPIAGFDSLASTDISFGGGVKYWPPGVEWLGLRFDVRRHSASEGFNFPGNDDSPTGTAVTVGAFIRLF